MKVIEKIEGPTDFAWVRQHPHYVPSKRPRGMHPKTFSKLRRKLFRRLPTDDVSRLRRPDTRLPQLHSRGHASK
jgi:hypothetical protein